MQREKIDRIIIVGGGTAGWSAAACLSRFCAKRDVEILVIDSDKVQTVGVGEASVPNIHNFNAYVGLNVPDFVRNTKATFKLGIKFDDWHSLNSAFFHPFGGFGADIEGLDFHQCAFAQDENNDVDLERYSLPAQLALSGKFAQPGGGTKNQISDFGFAYHFDAALYAKTLRSLALSRGVRHIDRLISGTELDPETGFIKSLVSDGGEPFEADLFIDCTGFRALLIEKAMGTDYVSWKHWLPCDRAYAVSCSPKEVEQPAYTVATAESAGWRWRIPLQSRIGNGYVYSSAHISDAEAEGAFRAQIEGEPLTALNHQRFEAGMRRTFWTKNCVSLGLASGFIEPLESTSINLVHRALSILMDLYPDRNFDPRKIREANRLFQLEQENIRDFIILHYKLSQRSDTTFWQDVRQMAIPDTLATKIDAYESSGSLVQYQSESFRRESWLAVYQGMKVKPAAYDGRADDLDSNYIRQCMAQIRESITRAVDQSSPHHTFLAQNGLLGNQGENARV